MTLLANRAGLTTSDKDAAEQQGRRDARPAAGLKTALAPRSTANQAAPVIAAPQEALRTLQTRLQAQLSKSERSGDPAWDGDNDPETRFLAQSVRRRLHQVNAALQRIEEGKYGACADCQELIEYDRLVLQPMATRCTRCQTVAEWRGAAY
jgi:RNA polymerase-binding transcription factor DksA